MAHWRRWFDPGCQRPNDVARDKTGGKRPKKSCPKAAGQQATHHPRRQARFIGNGKADVKNAIMTGVSWMLPFVIAGAVIMGIARIGASLYGIDNIWDAISFSTPMLP